MSNPVESRIEPLGPENPSAFRVRPDQEYEGFRPYLERIDREGDRTWTEMESFSDYPIVEKYKPNYSVIVRKGRGDLDGESSADQGFIITSINASKLSGVSIVSAPEYFVDRARAQRAYYLSESNSPEMIAYLQWLEASDASPAVKPIAFAPLERTYLHTIVRKNKASRVVSEKELKRESGDDEVSFADFAYKTRASRGKQSRSALLASSRIPELWNQRKDIFVKIGKYFRLPIALAPMPDTAGSVDAVTTAAMSHMLAIIPRNLEFKDVKRQVAFARQALARLDTVSIPGVDAAQMQKIRQMWKRNVGAAIGVNGNDVERFEALYDAGIRTFRIYSIATDDQIAYMTKELVNRKLAKRDAKKIELFIGQITSFEQFEALVDLLTDEEWNAVDGIYLGNGGGRQCKTAETGMVVNTPSLLYRFRNHEKMKGKSIIVEGGVGNEPATAFLVGATGISYANKISGGTLESPGGDLYFEDKRGQLLKRYCGEASPDAKIIEGMVYENGDTIQVEGANGFTRLEKKAPSMTAKIARISEWISQSFAKIGVSTMEQLQSLGVLLTKEELEARFGRPVDDIRDAYQLADDEDGRYIIPLPLTLRTEAQRAIAPSYGTGERVGK